MNDDTFDIALDNLPSVDDCVPDEQGGPPARSGFTYQDHVAAEIVLTMICDPAICQVHCETMDDIVIVWEAKGTTPRIAEFVQVKTTTQDSMWSCARLCASGENSGASLFEKSLAKDRVKEEARFRIVTSQHVTSKLRILTYERSHEARAPGTAAFAELLEDIDQRCPGAKSLKGTTSKTWLHNTLWVEGPPLESLRIKLQVMIMKRSALLFDQADKILLALLDWIRRAGDAKYIPDKDKKIISRSQAVAWWEENVAAERDGAKLSSGVKLRRKMPSDVAPADMLENALALRRHYAEEIRSPKYMEAAETTALEMDVRARVMHLRLERFSGQNNETPGAFHKRCVEAAMLAATVRVGDKQLLRSLAMGCLYDIVDRCQLEFGRPA